MPRKRSAFATPCSVTETVLCFSSNSKSKSATNSFFGRGSMPSGFLPGLHRCASLANCTYKSAACSGAPEMISGVRASSMRMLSTSSTIAKLCIASGLAVLADAAAVLDLLLQRRAPCCRAGSRSRTRSSCRR